MRAWRVRILEERREAGRNTKEAMVINEILGPSKVEDRVGKYQCGMHYK